MVEGLAIAPQACLLDSGATAIRLGSHVAELCGLDLSDAPRRQVGVGGALVDARMADVNLRVADDEGTYAWTAPVWFCDPWTPAFGLLGLTGFFDHFEVTISSYRERIELTPISG
ncbi:MAG: retropepsin-like domain-containing protein [Solirubrobacteraceae bacterium MAG38_C4-C5]|nr:retropepsin-like domain-containing protein [Candidatus Siliceabacter maunaloa]